MAKNEVAKVDNFNLVAIDADMRDAIAEEMDGLGTLSLDRIKIPSGGGLAFEVPGEDEDNPETATELVGVILYHHPVNAYWRDAYSGGNEAPNCSSLDGKTGVDMETGEVRSCADCPHNQFASDGTGKECKNMNRLYLLLQDNPVPMILTLPPTSLKPLKEYIGKRVLLKGYRTHNIITRITLKKDKSVTGITYSKAAFAFAGTLNDDQKAAAASMRDFCIAIDSRIGVSDDEYSAPQVDENGFTEAPDNVPEFPSGTLEGYQEELPL